MARDEGMAGALGSALRNNPAAQRLSEELRNYLKAKLTSATGKLQQAGENGGILGKAGEAAVGKMAEGESPGKAAVSGAASGVKEKLKSVAGGKGGASGGQATVIIEDLDIGVPVSVAYDQWTQFDEFPSFMKGVERVEYDDEDPTASTWRFKVFLSRRTNEATVTEQIPDRRIAWTSEGSLGRSEGAITFHPIGDDLTKVLLVLEYYPSGFVEKTGNLWRAVGRRARLDLKRFRQFITKRGEATGSWRGEIRDGEVVSEPE